MPSLTDLLFQKPFGLVDEGFDPRDVWEDEVLAGSNEMLPAEYLITDLPYEAQGAYPFCVSFAATTLAENAYRKESGGEHFAFSQPHLFFHSGGSKAGSGFRANLMTLLDKGAIALGQCPMPDPKIGRGNEWFEEMRPGVMSVPFKDAKKIGGFVRVPNTELTLKEAVMKYNGLLVGVKAGKGNYYTGNGTRVTADDNHAVLLVGWTRTHWVIFDSLWWVQKNKMPGYGTLDKSYTFPSAYAITKLPDDWKQKRDESRAEGWDFVLNHYGQTRNFARETVVQYELLKAFNDFKNRSVSEAAGKFWLIYINAVVYGGYSYQDIVNDCYNWRRTGQHIFNFNSETRDAWKKRVMGLK